MTVLYRVRMCGAFQGALPSSTNKTHIMLHIDFHLLRQAAISNTTSTATAEWSKRRVWRTAVMLVAGLAALPVHALTLTELFEKALASEPNYRAAAAGLDAITDCP